MSCYWSKKELLVLLDNKHLTAKQVANLLPNRTHIAIKHKRQQLNMGFEWRGNTKYKLNHDFFAFVTPLTSYWAGFIAADGNISKTQNCLRISLKMADKKHLERLKKDLQFTGPIKDTIKKCFDKTYEQALLQVSSKKILFDLKKNFNIIPNKTFKIQPPKFKDISLELAFISGYLDGDGSVSGRGPSIQITGNSQMLKWIKSVFDCFSPNLKEYKNADVRQITKAADGICSYNIYGKRVDKIIKAILAMKLPLLERKWHLGRFK